MTKKEINKLDRLAREWAVNNFNGKCIFCAGEKMLNIHHYIGRRNRATRWYKENLIALCPTHHKLGIQSAHEDPEWFRKNMLDLWGKKWLDDLTKQSNKVFKGTFQDVKNYLEDKTNNYI